MLRHAPLAPAFVRRMLPLALVSGALVGVLLPLIWGRLALTERVAEAAVWARQAAEGVERLAAERPRLWAYDEAGLFDVVGPLAGPPVEARVRVELPGRAGVFEVGPEPAPDAVVGWAVVRVEGRAVARVRVAMAAGGGRTSARQVWIGAGLAGAALAAALLVLPLWTVRRGDGLNETLWAALTEAHAGLEARVAERTAELRALGNRLVTVQEEERARISRDLHDELGQTLTGLRLQLTALEGRLAGDVASAAKVGAALSALDQAVEDVRRLARNLRPPALDALGLAAAVRGHAERWAEAAGLVLHLEVGPVAPSVDVAEALFRVAQEALTNVARHAGASTVRLVLDDADDGWRLIIEDDGRGRPDEGDGGGLGLVGARERVEALGGYLDLESPPAGGLRLLAWVPRI